GMTPHMLARPAQTMPRALLLGLALAVSACSGPARAPIADRPINLEGHCEQRESDGFREQARISVRSNQVHSLSWQLWVGSRGSCRFEFADFRQTRSRPHIELNARDGSGCRLLIWQDDRRITLGHAGCASRCTGSILEEAWPVMFDPRSGACARTAS
ncbi:MAG: hypothetical protein RLZZ153_2108, partial [Pseudomonadota bacterium]